MSSFAYLHLADKLVGELLDDGGEHFAGAAPNGGEVDENGDLGIEDLFLPIEVVQMNQICCIACHVSLSMPPALRVRKAGSGAESEGKVRVRSTGVKWGAGGPSPDRRGLPALRRAVRGAEVPPFPRLVSREVDVGRVRTHDPKLAENAERERAGHRPGLEKRRGEAAGASARVHSSDRWRQRARCASRGAIRKKVERFQA